MKKHKIIIKRTLEILFCLFAFCIFGCAAKDARPETIVLESVYTKDLISLDEHFVPAGFLELSGSTLYVYGAKEGSICIAKVEEPSLVVSYVDTEIASIPMSACKTSEGYAVLTVSYDSYTYKEAVMLHVISEDGVEKSTFPIPISVGEGELCVMWADEEKAYIATSRECRFVHTTTRESEFLFSFDSLGTLVSVSILDASPVFLLENPYGEQEAYGLDESSKPYRLNIDKETLKTAHQVYLLSNSKSFIRNMQGFYTISEGLSPLMNWINSCIVEEDVIDCVLAEPSQMFLLYRDPSSENQIFLYSLKPSIDTENNERTVVHVSYKESGAHILPKAAAQYNAQSQNYFVICEEKATIFTETSEQSAFLLSDFDKQILNGTAGDVIVTSSDNIGKYAEKKVLCDLSEFTQADLILSEEKFWSCVLESLEYQDHLYALPPSFYIRTLVGKSDLLPVSGWNLRGFLDFSTTLLENQRLLPVMNRENWKNILLSYSVGAYVDLKSGNCTFTDPPFIDILRYLNALPEKFQRSSENSEVIAYREGNYLLYQATIGRPADILALTVRFGDEDINMIGYPGRTEGVSAVIPSDCYAISVNSPVKEGAWEFICYMMTKNRQIVHSDDSIPSLKDFYDEWVKAGQKYVHQFDGDTETYMPLEEGMVEEGDKRIYQVSDELMTKFQKWLEAMDSVSILPKTVSEIIEEECIRYFEGIQTEEETANILQSRIELYLNEKNESMKIQK